MGAQTGDMVVTARRYLSNLNPQKPILPHRVKKEKSTKVAIAGCRKWYEPYLGPSTRAHTIAKRATIIPRAVDSHVRMCAI